MDRISFIIPCYRSEATISSVVEDIIAHAKEIPNSSFEVVLVNDSSPDNVYEVIQILCRKYPCVKGISLARNFGQHAAIMSGLHFTDADYYVFLDDDGQNPAAEAHKLIEALQVGKYDVVCGRYGRKEHSLFRNLGSKINDIMARCLIGKPKGLFVSSYFACKKYVVQEMKRYTNPYPYLPGLFFRSCHRIGNVDIEHKARAEGQSGYTLQKLFALWLNGFTAFSVKPLRVATITGLLFAVVGFVVALKTVIQKFLNPLVPAGYSSIMSAMLIIGGITMLMIGMIGEYIGRIYISMNNAPQFVVRETVNISCVEKEDSYEDIP